MNLIDCLVRFRLSEFVFGRWHAFLKNSDLLILKFFNVLSSPKYIIAFFPFLYHYFFFIYYYFEEKLKSFVLAFIILSII